MPCRQRWHREIVEGIRRTHKVGGNNGQHDPNFTSIPQPDPSTARDDWKPIVGTPFVEGSRGGDDGIRRVLEMVCAAVVPK